MERASRFCPGVGHFKQPGCVVAERSRYCLGPHVMKKCWRWRSRGSFACNHSLQSVLLEAELRVVSSNLIFLDFFCPRQKCGVVRCNWCNDVCGGMSCGGNACRAVQLGGENEANWIVEIRKRHHDATCRVAGPWRRYFRGGFTSTVAPTEGC